MPDGNAFTVFGLPVSRDQLQRNVLYTERDFNGYPTLDDAIQAALRMWKDATGQEPPAYSVYKGDGATIVEIRRSAVEHTLHQGIYKIIHGQWASTGKAEAGIGLSIAGGAPSDKPADAGLFIKGAGPDGK